MPEMFVFNVQKAKRFMSWYISTTIHLPFEGQLYIILIFYLFFFAGGGGRGPSCMSDLAKQY